MQTKLQQHFPMIQDREAILLKIRENRTMDEEFQSWTEEQREEFLDFCTGVRGIKFLYDGFFKEIFDPDATPERLEAFLSLFLGTRVKILEVLPLDGSRIADESSLLTMDMVVQLEDGGIVNLEIQKIGYLFPGERSACCSADLLLRQYKRVRSSRRKNFTYKDIKGVYTLVLSEKSPRIFHRFPNDYLHYFEQKSNTDLELDLLQKYLFIPLDIFRKSLDNRSKFPQNTSKIKAEQDAWLTFLSVDDPEKILELIKEFPQFKPMYETAYQQCCNVEEVMRMFSEELLELDRNTTQLMIDEMQEEIEQKSVELGEKKEELEEKKTELEAKKVELSKKKEELEKKKTELEEKKAELGERNQQLNEKKAELEEKKTELGKKKAELSEKKEELEAKKAELGERNQQLTEKKAELEEKKVELSKKKEELEEKKQQLSERKAELGEKTQQLNEKKAELEAKKVELGERNQQLNEKKAELEAKKAELGEKTQQLNEKKAELEVITQRLEDQKTELEEKTQQLEDQKTRWAEKEKASVRRLYDKLQSVAEVAEILGMEIEQVKVCLGL
ncbi:hypothetical protein [Dorea phocaeensis]|uniref:hypothetical protein n=1 Tax=Dorea phocaeensis TaxID=2040291 RepID=UPI002ED1C255